jgi:hypothetical protein
MLRTLALFLRGRVFVDRVEEDVRVNEDLGGHTIPRVEFWASCGILSWYETVPASVRDAANSEPLVSGAARPRETIGLIAIWTCVPAAKGTPLIETTP